MSLDKRARVSTQAWLSHGWCRDLTRKLNLGFLSLSRSQRSSHWIPRRNCRGRWGRLRIWVRLHQNKDTLVWWLDLWAQWTWYPWWDPSLSSGSKSTLPYSQQSASNFRQLLQWLRHLAKSSLSIAFIKLLEPNSCLSSCFHSAYYPYLYITIFKL